MTLVGLDPSLQAFGVAIIAPEGYTTTVIREHRTTGPERLVRISGCVSKLIPGGALVAMEGYSYGSQGVVRGLLARAELVGHLGVMLWDRGIRPVTVPPASLKLYATGHGNAGKADVIAAVRDRWGIDLRTDDAADAYVLARILRDAHAGERGWCRKAEGVLDAVRRQLEEVA